jgi:type I phosphodiesterase/nucleotide pyrophosphatase/Calx-beta domain-containing protein/hemolysin type calcium-binding protein/beta-propeller repeat-containing protein
VGRLPGVVNDLRGDDASRWRTHVPTFERVRYREVYPGVDLDWHGTQQRLEYDFRVAPGADPGQIALRVAGADRVRVARNGDLVIAAGGEAIRQSAPVAYQGEGATRTPVDARFELRGNTVSLALGHYDRSRPLVIDPVVLDYSTYLGGNGAERVNGIAVDSSGASYLTGRTLSTDFNRVGGVESVSGQGDVFVSKLNAAGNALVYSTYLGGEGDDSGNGIAVDASGAYLVGTTESTDFNTVNPASPNKDEGIADAFVAKLNPAGDGLVYSTYLGGGGGFADGGSNSGQPPTREAPFQKKAGASDEGVAIAVDSSGAAYVAGNTHAISSDAPGSRGQRGFPIKGWIEGDTSETQPYGGGSAGAENPSSMTSDAFVTKLTPTGNEFVYSTYLGGDLGDGATAIAVDSAGSAYVAGATNSPDFNRVGGIEGRNGIYANNGRRSNFDAFVSKLNPAGNALVYSTYLGGSDFDAAHAIAVDGAGAAYVAGTTDSSDFNLVKEIEGDSNGPDAFVSKLNPAGGALEYSTYLGGGLADAANSIALGSGGRAFVTGTTSSRNFDRAGELEDNEGLEDAFVSSLNPGGGLACSTYLGGTGADSGNAIAVGPSGAAYVAGSTESSDFNTDGPLEGNSGGPDAFASKLGGLARDCGPRRSGSAEIPDDDLQVYVVVLDGLRPQEVDAARTPFLNELKEGGTWYEQARSVFLAETLPNHAAMMTGVLPQRSGLLGNDYWERNTEPAQGYNHRMLDPTKLDVETLPTTLEESCDVSSASVMSKGYLWYLLGGGEPPNPDDAAWQRRPDYVWGAPESDEYIPDPDDHTPDASVMRDGFMPWLQSDPPSPRFAFLNLGDVDRAGHIDASGATTPGYGPAPGGTVTAFRQAALTDTDTQVRLFVNELKQPAEDGSTAWDHSVLIFISDHGMDWSTPDHETGGQNNVSGLVPGITTTNEVRDMPGVARVVSGGGTTMFYLQPGTNPATVKDVADTLKSVEGIETVATRTPIAGYPTLDDLGMAHPDAGDIVGLNKPGWRDGGFHSTGGNPLPGNHGHAVTQHSTLFVTGGHPALDERPESVDGPVVYDPSKGIYFSRPDGGPGNLSVAPTVSRLFGLQGPEGGYDGSPLGKAFDNWALEPHTPCQVSDLPVLDSTDVRITEGDSGTRAAKVVVRLTKPGKHKVSVDYRTVQGTAEAPSDYEPQGPSTLKFDPGETQKTISIPVNGDVRDEGDESFRVRFSGQSNAELGDHDATVTIVDDDGKGDGGGGRGGGGGGGDRSRASCAGRTATIIGTVRSDRRRRLRGTARRDVIAALGGKDRAAGRGRADTICGGPGADALRGGRGRDRVRGDAGRDRLFGGKRKDRLIGGRGRDRIFAAGGARDRIKCGRGRDVVYAGPRDKVARSCENVLRRF